MKTYNPNIIGNNYHIHYWIWKIQPRAIYWDWDDGSHQIFSFLFERFLAFQELDKAHLDVKYEQLEWSAVSYSCSLELADKMVLSCNIKLTVRFSQGWHREWNNFLKYFPTQQGVTYLDISDNDRGHDN